EPVTPGPDQPAAPAAADHLADPLGGGRRQHAQRVPVHVDQRWIITHEAVAEACQWVGGIALLREGPIEQGVRHGPTVAPVPGTAVERKLRCPTAALSAPHPAGPRMAAPDPAACRAQHLGWG